MPTKPKNGDSNLPEKYKATVTYQRQKKFKDILYKIADKTFNDDTVPDIKIPTPKETGGRPLKYQTAKQLQDEVKAFFQWCGDNMALPTVNGLSLYLGWYTELFYNYIKIDGFSQVLKKARDLMAYRLEINAEETGNPGPMFLLKASHGYSDEREIQVNVTLDVEKLYSKALRNTQNKHTELSDNAAKRIGSVETLDDVSS